jgi:ureidoacrylate peracid hydrolase
MHPFELPRPIVDRVGQLRDRLHPFDPLDPARTALVVIDMQNVFLARGAAYEVPAARSIVPAINRLARTVRRTGGVVAWVKMSYSPDDPWSSFYDHMLGPERAKGLIAGVIPDSDGHRLWAELEVLDDDIVSLKDRFSAFLPGHCDLAERLRARGVDTVLISGTLTNTCCESSARDAAMLDFKTIMVSDANATVRDELHAAALANFIQVLGDVRTTDEVIELLERASVPARAAE